jgi:peptide/nickel transport system substrate-binding protein
MRRRAAILAVLALLAAASGCGGNGSAGTGAGAGLLPAGGGGTLSYALPGLPPTLDPLAAHGRAALTVTRQVYEPLIERLVRPYGQSVPQPGLALSAVPSGDQTTWTIALRQGVRFQDGTPFNAGAVLANSRRWASDRAGRRLLPHLFAVDSPRPDEVRFLLDKPVPDLVARLASPRLGIVSPQALEPQSGQRASFRPEISGSGTGAFQAGATGPGRLELSRFAGWWGSAEGLGPALDGVTFVAAPQQAERLRLLREGSVQVADSLGPAVLHAAEADPFLETIGGPGRGIGTDGSVRGIDSARTVPVLSGVWLTDLTG